MSERASGAFKLWLHWLLGGFFYLLLLIAFLVVAGLAYRPMQPVSADEENGWIYPNPNRPLQLPGDLAAHPNYRNEWWRFAGLLKDYEGHRFYFILQVHCLAEPRRLPGWLDNAVRKSRRMVGRLTLFNLGDGHFRVEELTSPKDGENFQAATEAFDLQLADWRIEQDHLQIRLNASAGEIGLSLTALPEKKPVLYGSAGYQWRGEAGAPVYSIGHPWLVAQGEVIWQNVRYTVEGDAFGQHEFTSYRLPPTTVGWDRMHFSLSNNHVIDLVRWRQKDNAAPELFLTIVLPDNSMLSLASDQLSFTPKDYWKSEETGIRYPVSWELNLEPYQAKLRLSSMLAGAEHRRFREEELVWESPIAVEGNWGDRPVRGAGTAELTGYRERPVHY